MVKGKELSLRKESVDGVMGVMRDLLRKPPREIPTPCEGIEQRQDDEEAKQKRINSIIARALAFIYPKRPAEGST